MNCAPNSLLQSARVFRCLPKSEISASLIYVLCRWANAQQCDQDALNFLTATGISQDSTEGRAICRLVADLKAYPASQPEANRYWARDTLIYPFVGGTPATCHVNLKTPGFNNLTAPVGAEPLYSATGVQGDKTKLPTVTRLLTGFAPDASYRNNERAFWYLDSDPTPVNWDAYFGMGLGASFFSAYFRTGIGAMLSYYGNDAASSTNFPDGFVPGAYCVQRYNATTKQSARNATGFVNSAVASAAVSGFNLPLLCVLATGVYAQPTSALMSGFSFGRRFESDAEWLEYRGIWQTFQTALGRAH